MSCLWFLWKFPNHPKMWCLNFEPLKSSKLFDSDKRFIFYIFINYKRTVRIETKTVVVYVCMAQVTQGACQKAEEGVDTLQAAEPPCNVSNGPVKIYLNTSVSGGLIYKIKHRIAK